MREHYDIVLVGSGFASIFFLHKILEKNAAKKILLIERGGNNSWLWQVQNEKNSPDEYHHARLIEATGMSGKTWPHTVGLGGGSNCWWANSLRLHPADFRLKSTYGVGVDWPLSYEDLERYYTQAEDIMSIAGDNDSSVIFPRSKPFPQPRHRFSRVARAFKTRYPDLYFAMPQARARVATPQRNVCCSNSVCGWCPMNAKFMIIQDLAWIFDDPRVDLWLETEVKQVIVEGGRATGVSCTTTNGVREAQGDLIVLGANGIYNPFLLLKSGIDHGPVGKGLTEQIPIYVSVYLDGMDDGDGSAHVTGIGYNFADGDFRRHAAGGFYETTNLYFLRPDPKKYRSMLWMVFLLDDLRQDRNYVAVSTSDPDKPRVHFEDWSPYAHAGLEHVRKNMESLLAHLPVERIDVRYGEAGGHAHFEGTTVMGTDPATSVIDPDLVHHRIRNLVVLGSGAFPTAGAMNPTLTLAAMALRSADRLFA